MIETMRYFTCAVLGAAAVVTSGAAQANLIYYGNIADVSVNFGSANNPLTRRTFANANVASAEDLVILMEAREPGNDNAITLNALTLTVYGPSGNDRVLFEGSYAGDPLDHPLDLITCPGQSNCVNAFILDHIQASVLQAVFGPNNRVALNASLSNAAGGPDRWLLSNRVDAGIPAQEISEPGSLALLGLGLVGLGLIGRRA